MRIEWAGFRSAAKLLTVGLALGLSATAALAADYGKPVDWQMNMQLPATEIAREVYNFHFYINIVMALVALFVLALIIAIVVKFNEKANPTPSRTTHNTLLEVAWTIVPVLILVAIAIPSFRIMRTQLADPKADVTLKVIGHAWYWEYEYPADQGGFKFDSNLAEGNDLKPGQPTLLAVDNEAVVPVGKIVKLQVTSADVLHSFAVPSFGFKIDAVPGRLNQMWFNAEREGVYYGQCSELCGARHAYMPIAIRVVSQDQYNAWLTEAKTKFAKAGDDTRFAAAR